MTDKQGDPANYKESRADALRRMLGGYKVRPGESTEDHLRRLLAESEERYRRLRAEHDAERERTDPVKRWEDAHGAAGRFVFDSPSTHTEKLRIVDEKTALVFFSSEVQGPNSERVLACPNCKNPYLHQHRTVVFERDEDAEMVLVTRSSRHGTTTNLMPNIHTNPSNPSPRRQGLVLRFKCETCNAEPELCISQHKGNTFVGWRYTVPQSEVGEVVP